MKTSLLLNIRIILLILVIGFGIAKTADGQIVSMSVNPATINEGSDSPTEAIITVTLSVPSFDGTNVELGFSGTADASDYSASVTLIQIPFGQSSGTSTISTENDEIAESTEELIVDIIGVSGGIENGVQQVTITILDDDVSLPIELVSFDASANGSEIVLQWETASEVNNAGFEIETSPDGETFARQAWSPSYGSGTQTRRYRHNLPATHSGTNFVRLKQVDLDGTYSYSDVRRVEVSIENGFEFYAPYPNPTSSEATLSFVSGLSENASLDLYDMTGKRVRTVFAGNIGAGMLNEVRVTTSDLAPGMYFARLSTKRGERMQRLAVVR